MLCFSYLNAQETSLALFNQAEKLADNGDYAKSNIAYLEALPAFLNEKNWPKYYQSRFAITFNYLDLYQFEKAEKEVLSSITHFNNNYQDTFIIQQAKLHHAAGQVYLDLNNYKEAIAHNRLAMKYYQNIKDHKERTKYTAFMYNNIGVAYKTKRTMDSAMHYFELALPLKIEALGQNASSTLRTIDAISGIYQDWGQLDKAIEMQTIALDGAIASGNKQAEAEAYNGLSQMYQRKKDFESSKLYIAKSLEIYKGLLPKQELNLAHSYHQMGNVLEAAKFHQESLEWYTTAKKMYRKIHNGRYSYQEGNSTMNLGKAHNFLAEQLENSSDEYDPSHPDVRALRAKAIEYFEENEKIFEASITKDHARFIELWLSKGVCYLENQDSLIAHELFEKAYNRAYKMAPEKSYDRSLACLNLARTTKNPKKALDLYQQGLWELSNGWEYDSHDDNPSAQEVFYENWSIEIMVNKVTNLQRLASAENNPSYLDAGIKTVVAADELLDESRASFLTTSAKISLGEMGHDVYSKGVELCFDSKNLASKAFDFIEKDKGLVLLEALHSGRRIQNVMVPDSLSGSLSRISAKIAELTAEQNQFKEQEKYALISAQIFDLETERKRIKKKIEEAYPVTSRISQEGQIISLDQVQEKLANNQVIYEYLKAEKHLYILKIQKDKAKLYKEDLLNITPNLDSLLNIISNEDIAINQSNSQSVYDAYNRFAYKLFKKLLPDYNNEDLLIIPDGNLNYLPFELLLTEAGANDQINYGLLPYLLKSGSIKYAFSTSLYFADIETPERNQDLLLAVAPSYPASPNGFLASRAGFSSLEHTEEEAKLVSDLVGGDFMVGKEATVERFKESVADYRLLHLAMHAFTHDKDPMLSGMVFSESSSEPDNILHAYELYNMEIPSDLVVLSACNTGLGQHKEGEGVMSLGRAFRHAGSKNVIMSLWQANDESTSEIMTNFYTKIEKGESKAEALRNAKLDYLATNANVFPYYWSTFVLLGDDQALNLSKSKQWYLFVALGSIILFLTISILVKRKSKATT